MLIKKTVFLYFSLLIFSAIGLFQSCKTDHRKIDTDTISIHAGFSRFDHDLFSMPQPVTVDEVAGLRKRYPAFLDLYCQRIIHIPVDNDSVIAANLTLFIGDVDVTSIYKKTKEVFADTKWLEAELMEMLKYYQHYFPGEKVPDIITYISVFNYTVITTDSALGIGLDMYLGKDCEFYPALGLPKYMTDKLSKEYIGRDAVKAIYQSNYDPDQVGTEFLSQIIYNGKLLYLTDMLLPETSDTIKTGYSAEQLKWVQQNETNIWGFMIEHDLLYSKEPSRYIRYINDGPGTQGLPKEAPARLGAWIGWRIVDAYMKKHEGMTLATLLNEKDAQKILSESGYKPAR